MRKIANIYGEATAANREPLAVGRNSPRMLLVPIATNWVSLSEPVLHCALALRPFLATNSFAMTFTSVPPAARASCSEDGRRSGTRRKATRRVEAIHAQELVQDDARDACPCVGIQDAGVQRTRGCVSSIELSKRTTAITPQTRYGSRPPTSRKTCRQKGQSGVRRKSSGPLESDFEQAAARPSIAARPFWRSTFSLKVRASGSS